MLRVVKVGGVEGGSIALVARDVKAVADELGMPMLLYTSSHSFNVTVCQQYHRETEYPLLRYIQTGHQIHSSVGFLKSQRQ